VSDAHATKKSLDFVISIERAVCVLEGLTKTPKHNDAAVATQLVPATAPAASNTYQKKAYKHNSSHVDQHRCQLLHNQLGRTSHAKVKATAEDIKCPSMALRLLPYGAHCASSSAKNLQLENYKEISDSSPMFSSRHSKSQSDQ